MDDKDDIIKEKSSQKVAEKFACKFCDYNTCNRFDFNKHNSTLKHENTRLAIQNGDLAIQISQKSPDQVFICENCNKEYKDNSGLWRHKKKCNLVEQSVGLFVENTDNNKDELLSYLMQENKEFKNLILEIVKKDTCATSHHITHTNSHNNSFNLNFFLNETCKDAMNITDFVDSIKLQLSDLERVGEVGYVEGISNIIVKSLKQLDDITLYKDTDE